MHNKQPLFRRFITFYFLFFLVIRLSAQINVENKQYQRSSLTMILLQGTNLVQDKTKVNSEDAKIDNSPEAIRKLWNDYPFPELYDKHEIADGNIKVVSSLSSQDIFNARKNKNQLRDAEKILPKIQEELKNKRIAHQVVRSWFSSEDSRTFWNMGTIQKRGYYNASDLDAEIAKTDARGKSKLADAGEELIKNSFVTVTDLLLYANKPIADYYVSMAEDFEKQAKDLQNKSAKDAMEQLVNSTAALTMQTTATGLRIAAAAIMDGYTVVSKTYLFKLKWNEEIEAEFYKNWGNTEAFEQMNFELEYINFQLNETVVNRGIFNKSNSRKPEVVIKQSVMRNIDEAFAKLQKGNDVFKPFVPVFSVEPLAAKIGMKEGLSGGEKFVLMQRVVDPSSGKSTYKKMGNVSVVKNSVWDNRYNLGDENQGNSTQDNITLFKGGKKATPGMLLKLKK